MNAVNAMVYFVLREATVKLITIMSECFVAVPVKAGHSTVFVCVCVPWAYSARETAWDKNRKSASADTET